MRRWVADLLLRLAGSLAGAQAPDPTEETWRVARELAQVMAVEDGIWQMLQLMREQTLKEAQAVTPDESPAEIEEIYDNMILPELRARLGEARDLFIELYVEHYTVEDMRDLRKFYSTPLGQRVLKANLAIAAKSNVASQAWGERVGNEVIRNNADELRRRGWLL